jgi:PQQ-dependent dehydrogenase (s-GDH family)
MKQSNARTAVLFFLALALPALRLSAQTENFNMRTVISGLSHPWEITWGPDNMLWVTESRSYQVAHINPTTGARHVMADLSAQRQFPASQDPWPQGGLMGLALHPDLFNGKPYVYLAYVYRFDSCAAGNGGCFFKTRLARFNFDAATLTLTNQVVMIDTIPGSSDHNGGRLEIGTVDGTPYLFYSVGDMGSGHLGNGDRPHHGQDPNYYEGKILRFNLEPDADATPGDFWIPNDNPMNTSERQSAVWTLGHRNPQGLVFANGILYESEHGPYSDDELNIIVAESNYGFPLIGGFADGNYNGLAVGAGSGVPLIVSEQANAAAIGPEYRDPIASFWPATNDTLMEIWMDDVNDTPPYPNAYLFWPTIAPSGIDHYSSTTIPGWQNSLLVTALKLGRIYRVPLAANGQSVAGPAIEYFVQVDRYRDIAISPDGSKIYIATDSVGQIRGNVPGEALQPTHRGAILEFAYVTSSTEEPSADAVRLFPNPARQNVVIDLGPLADGVVGLKAFNSVCTTVWQTRTVAQPVALDVAGWPGGPYTLAVELEGGKVVMKKFTVVR